MAALFRFKELPKITLSHEGGKMDTPAEIYEQSVAFRRVYETCNSKIQEPADARIEWEGEERFRTLAFSEASFVNLAFSCELLLKAISFSSSGTYCRKHNLESLFNQLDERYKQKIIRYVLESEGKNKKNTCLFNRLLSENSRTFEVLRYSFDSESHRCNPVFLAHFNEVLDDIYHNFAYPCWDGTTKTKRDFKGLRDWFLMSEEEKVKADPFYAGILKSLQNKRRNS
jgi:HEPN domain-containing protein